MKKIFTSIVLMLLTVAYAMADTSVWTMNTTLGIAEVTVVKQGTQDTGGALELKKDGFTVTSSKGYFKGSGSNGIQIYAGGAMTITAPENCVITSIVLQYPSSCYPFSEAYPEGGAADKKTDAQTDVTFTPEEPAEAFIFTNAATGQTKVKKLTINYEEVQASTEISELVAGGKTTVNLDGTKEYTLNNVATLATDVVTINGNGAKIVVGENGKFATQKGLKLIDVKLDATATQNSVIELSSTPDESLFTFGFAYGTPATYYTAEEAAAYNEEWAQEIAENEPGYVTKHEGDLKTEATEGYKYPNATWKGYEAEIIELNGVTFMTNNSIIRPGAAWALHNLVIDNCIIEVKYKSGKAVINMEENGAGVIQDIVIKNSTLYADDPATDMRFHRYAAQNDPWRVWGYEGEDKNATKDTWTLTNNTIVGLCGNKEFSNNMKNTNATEFTFTGNAFVNTWRINKLGGNCKRNFVQTDNVISGGTNAVDGTDGNWFTAVNEDDLGIEWDFGGYAPAATDPLISLFSYFHINDEYSIYGDQRWNDPVLTGINSVVENTADVKVRKAIVNGKIVIVKNGATYNVAGQIVK